MLRRKFKNGPYVYQGQTVNMYQLSKWIGKYNRKNNANLRPSTVEEKHIKLFLANPAQKYIESLEGCVAAMADELFDVDENGEYEGVEFDLNALAEKVNKIIFPKGPAA